MEPISLIAIMLTVGASAVGPLAKRIFKRRVERDSAINSEVDLMRTANHLTKDDLLVPPPKERLPAHIVVLLSFGAILVVLGSSAYITTGHLSRRTVKP